jgi:hypothetical protein
MLGADRQLMYPRPFYCFIFALSKAVRAQLAASKDKLAHAPSAMMKSHGLPLFGFSAPPVSFASITQSTKSLTPIPLSLPLTIQLGID